MAKRGSTSKTLVWILMAMLILGLGGFGVTNLGGNVRSVGSVGDKEIDIDAYARALREEIRAVEAQIGRSLTFAEAQQLGLDRVALSQLVSQRALDAETERLGLSIGDENLRRQILEIDAFTGTDGTFDRANYRFALEQSGLTEARFEANMREDTARQLLQGALVGGVEMPAGYIDTLMTYIGEERRFSFARLDAADLESALPEPDAQQLAAYHAENEARFTLPEMKRITFAWLTPEMLIDEVEIDETALQAVYDERIDEFQKPERRLVERLAFSDQAAAQAAREAIEAGETSFETLVEERGLALGDVDLGDMRKEDLGAAGDAVFAAEAGAVVGPVATPVGPALFRVNGVLQAEERSFDEVRDELRDELAADRARRVVESRIDPVNDLLAGGATLEEVAKETELKLGRIDWFENAEDPVNRFPAFREVAAEVTAEDFPEVMQAEDGTIFAMRLDEVLAPRVQPLEDVREAVAAAWRDSETEARLLARAGTLVERLAEGASPEELGLEMEQPEPMTRGGFVEKVPPGFVETVFQMAEGEIRTLAGEGQVAILRLDAITPPDAGDAEVAQTREILRQQAENGLSQDLYIALAEALRARAGIDIDTQALNAVHANFR